MRRLNLLLRNLTIAASVKILLAVMITVSFVVTPLMAIDKPNQDIELLGSVDYRSPAKKLAISGDYAYLFAGGLRVIDILDPTNPLEVNQIPSFEMPFDFFISDNLAYTFYFNAVSGMLPYLKILDISDPRNLVEVGSIEFQGRVTQIVVEGKYAYINYGGKFAIMDVSDPENLSVEVIYDDNWVGNFDVVGEYVYMNIYDTSRTSIFKIINMADPSNTIIMSNTSLNVLITRIKVLGNYAYLLTRSKDMMIYDISDPENPVYVNTIKLWFDKKVLSISGDILTLSDGNYYDKGKLYGFDLSDPLNPKEIIYPSLSAYQFQISGNIAYLADGKKGFRILDLSKIHEP